ncbi:hypothetical protein Tco_1068943 [Tanacetum coccineum]|uniref:Uncharacterized protein n=1 Tax=Tanacetum coccineum TaxID=301880 RepID=A0ABQ5HH28_9ASTR
MTNRDAKDCQGGNKGRDKVGRQGGEEKGTVLVCYLAGSGDRATKEMYSVPAPILKFGKWQERKVDGNTAIDEDEIRDNSGTKCGESGKEVKEEIISDRQKERVNSIEADDDGINEVGTHEGETSGKQVDDERRSSMNGSDRDVEAKKCKDGQLGREHGNNNSTSGSTYANMVTKELKDVDNKLSFVPTEVSDDGSEVVIFDEALVSKGNIQWKLSVCGHLWDIG